MSSSTSCSTNIFSCLVRSRYFVQFFISFIFPPVTWWNVKIHVMKSSFLSKLSLVFWPGLSDLFQNLREFYASQFLRQILVCAYTICQHCQILISCTLSRGLSPSSSHIYSCTPFMPVASLMWLTVSCPHHLQLLFSLFIIIFFLLLYN